MNGLDAIILRRELGRILLIRKLVCTDMEYFGMELDEAKNEIRSKEMRIRHILKLKLW
jgi:acetate kinase